MAFPTPAYAISQLLLEHARELKTLDAQIDDRPDPDGEITADDLDAVTRAYDLRMQMRGMWLVAERLGLRRGVLNTVKLADDGTAVREVIGI